MMTADLGVVGRGLDRAVAQEHLDGAQVCAQLQQVGREAVTKRVGIASLILGISMGHKDDEVRLARGSAVLDDLYAYFVRKAPAGGDPA